MEAVDVLTPEVGTRPACVAMGIPPATVYRHRTRRNVAPLPVRKRPSPQRALTSEERQQTLDVLHSEEFMDKAPQEVYAALLDQGHYLCSIRTMYRLLEENQEVRERRNQLRHPSYAKPELLATAANQVWSWDITKLLGPVKWTYFYLYVILDIFSRYVVGWMVADRESAELAKRLIAETCRKQNIAPDQLTIHADRGTSMTSKPVACSWPTVGVTKTPQPPARRLDPGRPRLLPTLLHLLDASQTRPPSVQARAGSRPTRIGIFRAETTSSASNWGRREQDAQGV